MYQKPSAFHWLNLHDVWLCQRAHASFCSMVREWSSTSSGGTHIVVSAADRSYAVVTPTNPMDAVSSTAAVTVVLGETKSTRHSKESYTNRSKRDHDTWPEMKGASISAATMSQRAWSKRSKLFARSLFQNR